MAAPGFRADDPYFGFAQGRYSPRDCALGPWAKGTLHGGAVCGAIGHAIERAQDDPARVPARFTVELLRLVSAEPFAVETRILRDGHLVRTVDAEIVQDGEIRARGSCQWVRPGEQPGGGRWSPPDWDVAAPETFAALEGLPREVRLISGELRSSAQRRAWVRELRPLVAGVALTPFQRLALLSDFASPFSSSGSEGLSFINTDVSVALHRLPAGEWIGVEVTDHQSSAGIAAGSCRIYDSAGSIGLITTVSLSRRTPFTIANQSPAGEAS